MTCHVTLATVRNAPCWIVAALLATVVLWRLPEAAADHGSRVVRPALVPARPLAYCRPLHVSSEPSEFRPGQAAERFGVFVDGECARRSEPVTVEVWYRAPYRDGQGREAFGMPYLVGFVETRTYLAEATPRIAGALRRFDVPGGAFRLYAGCYVGRIRITATADEPPSGQVAQAVEHAAEVERCTTQPQLSLPGPR